MKRWAANGRATLGGSQRHLLTLWRFRPISGPTAGRIELDTKDSKQGSWTAIEPCAGRSSSHWNEPVIHSLTDASERFFRSNWGQIKWNSFEWKQPLWSLNELKIFQIWLSILMRPKWQVRSSEKEILSPGSSCQKAKNLHIFGDNLIGTCTCVLPGLSVKSSSSLVSFRFEIKGAAMRTQKFQWEKKWNDRFREKNRVDLVNLRLWYLAAPFQPNAATVPCGPMFHTRRQCHQVNNRHHYHISSHFSDFVGLWVSFYKTGGSLIELNSIEIHIIVGCWSNFNWR